MEAKLATRPAMHVPARAWRASRWGVRRLTNRWRMLPRFVIIGAPRSGTTSLYRAMCEHPGIAPSFRKEVHYFDGRTDRGPGWYRASFPIARSSLITGEATPNYFAHPTAPTSVATMLPDVRLIALLRDPIERAHSSWRLKVFQGHERRTFSEAIHEEGALPLSAAARRDATSDGIRSSNGFAYLEKSRYAEHLERWLTEFPTEQLLVLKAEDLFSAPDRHLDEIFDFVGIERSDVPQLPHHHAAPPADIAASDREWLESYFAPYNRKLADITGVTFG